MSVPRLRPAALLVGPGASAGERRVTAVTAGCGAFTAVAWPAWQGGAGWHWWQYAVVALDLFGGAAANATDAARRWWHRPGRGARHRLGFVVAHGQPFVLALTVPGYGWATAAATHGAVLAAAVAVTAAPGPLRRPVAHGAAALVTAGLLLIPPDAGPYLAWVAPVLAVKLLLAHLLPEGAGR
ncbi:hypothetical protein [Streptomyces aidingensis]|uniref:Uncharacterized protein n=1 Tax=Streptomyces aidingensis TaxID=910347 RepID=A0A1I1SK43_9ACTN|nr:hypothetical protein [Streptomyces aidingensis]SFD46826.1 hypothetical protein SAMN05421773_11667 [Streptomyces aidingensis]